MARIASHDKVLPMPPNARTFLPMPNTSPSTTKMNYEQRCQEIERSSFRLIMLFLTKETGPATTAFYRCLPSCLAEKWS